LPIRPSKSLSYFVPPPPLGWAVIGSFSVADWYAARRILDKRNIVARMGNAVDESGQSIQLLVPAGNLAYAQALLAGGIHSMAEVEPRPGGFPVIVAGMPQQQEAEVPFANPVHADLSPRQITNYNLVLVIAWAALIAVVFLTAVLLFLPT
jgi:hypothetical protein